jgi:hypothetical protein
MFHPWFLFRLAMKPSPAECSQEAAGGRKHTVKGKGGEKGGKRRSKMIAENLKAGGVDVSTRATTEMVVSDNLCVGRICFWLLTLVALA